MTSVGIKALKDELSHYVRRAAGGETVAITDRGRVVAQLVPAPPVDERHDHDLTDEEWIDRMVAKGKLSAADRTPYVPPTDREAMLDVSFEQLMRDLDEDRADRW